LRPAPLAFTAIGSFMLAPGATGSRGTAAKQPGVAEALLCCQANYEPSFLGNGLTLLLSATSPRHSMPM
jgi:hypothetical protein